MARRTRHPGTVRSDVQEFRQISSRFQDEVGRILGKIDFVQGPVPFWALMRVMFPVAESLGDLIYRRDRGFVTVGSDERPAQHCVAPDGRWCDRERPLVNAGVGPTESVDDGMLAFIPGISIFGRMRRRISHRYWLDRLFRQFHERKDRCPFVIDDGRRRILASPCVHRCS